MKKLQTICGIALFMASPVLAQKKSYDHVGVVEQHRQVPDYTVSVTTQRSSRTTDCFENSEGVHCMDTGSRLLASAGARLDDGSLELIAFSWPLKSNVLLHLLLDDGQPDKHFAYRIETNWKNPLTHERQRAFCTLAHDKQGKETNKEVCYQIF